MPASSAGASPVMPSGPCSPSPSSAGSSPISPPVTPGPGNRPNIGFPIHHPPHPINRNSIDRITGPQPVDHEKLRQLEHQRVTTFQLMLEKERCYVDRLRSELARSNDPKKSQELANAERRVRTLQQQLLMAMTPNPATAPSSAMTSPTSSSDHYEQATVPQPSQSSTHTHQRAKSSPDPLSMATGDAGSKSMGVTGSVSDLSLGGRKSKGGSGVWESDSPRVTPPGTPPPPYGVMRVAGGGHAAMEVGGGDVAEEADSGHHHHHHTDTDGDSSHRPNGGGSVSGHSVIGNLPIQQPIIAMEDDEMSDQEVGQVEDYGPFKSLSKLWEHTAHLAVFLNYVISNSDPSSLLFYLLTDLYKEGNAKEMRKWAYEVHSVFLVPGAPLRLNNVDENVAREVDEVLLYESDKEEILRRVFWKARVKAKEELNEELADFQQKRTAGLGTLFGPTDPQLDESIHDKNKEAKIIESILQPLLEPTIEDIDNESDVRRTMTALALITVAGKTFGLRSSQYSNIVDRVPTFVSKEKSLKSKIMGKSRKLTIKGHNFVLHQYYTVTHCNHCGLIIWGISPQGYQCTNCQMNIHRYCFRTLEENCAGPLLKKERANDRISKLMEKIRPEREARRKPSSLNSSQIERAKKHGDEHEDGGHLTDGESCHHGDRPVSGVSSGSGGRSSDRRPDPVRESEEHHHPPHHGPRRSPLHGSDGAGRNHEEDLDHSHHPHHHYRHESMHHMARKGSGASINRSESYKERAQKKQLRERRKTSDPNLSKTNDVDADNQGLSYHTNSGSSSNSSSLSSHVNNLDTRSSSLEMVTGGAACGSAAGAAVGASDHNTFISSGAWPKVDAVGFSVAWNDSDTEAEPDPPDWTKAVPEEALHQLTPREKKRQDVINELFHTERSHVRNLKVLDRIFYRPMIEQCILPPEQIHLLFSNLDEMLEIHSQFNSAMKAKRRENPIVERVGDILLNMLDGPCGENFERAAAKFCARQQIALESLKESRRKDARLNSFLTDAEMKPVCRRLQLKDIIPTGMLRLTKYPLLFESLAKYTDDDGKTEGSSMGKERSQILRALERSKRILDSVNQAVREAEDQHRLQVIQQRLEKAAFEKADHPMSNEFKNLDLTRYRLVYEGALSWRAGNRSKTIDLHVVLLEEIVILLLKQDDKFVLRFHSVSSGAVGGAGGGGSGSGGRDDSKLTHSPIIKLATVLVRPVATDKRAFFLVNTSGAQIYELVAVSSSERKTWFRHISEAAEAYKARDAKNKRPDLPSISPAAQIPTGPTIETPSQPIPPPPSCDATTPAKTKDTEENGEVPNVAVDGSEEGEVPKNNDQTAPAATPASSAELEAMAQKIADGKQPCGLEGGSPQQQLSPGAPGIGLGSSPAPSPGTQRRGIGGGGGGGSEPLRLLTEECPLIQPSEVVVSQRAVLTAQPVLTPLEKLRRKDEVVMDALLEKHLLVADLLHVPHEEFDSIAEIASEPAPDRDINELLLSAIYHTDNLKAAINETLRVSEEEAVSARSEGTVHTCGMPVGTNASGCSPRAGGRRPLAHRMPGVPVPPLLNISSALSSTLSLLLKHVKEREEERDRLRRELQRSRELIHARNQNEQRLQWQDADLLSSDSATEANADLKGEDIEGCESGVRGLDLRASAAEGDVVDPSPQAQVISNLNTSLQNSEGEIEELEDQVKGKSLGESTDDPGGDVYVDALSYGDTEVAASKEQVAEGDGDMEEDSLEGEEDPIPPAPKVGTDVPDGC